MFNLSDTQRIGTEIIDILYEYLKIPSFSNSDNEKLVDEFFNEYFSKIKYFKDNPSHFGQYKIPEDIFKRSVNWGFVKGSTKKTVVMIHHSDIVNVENFGPYQAIAFSPDEISKAFMVDERYLDMEAKEDLNSGKWIFGRGSADMKGGGAIQLALLNHYSKVDYDIPNILVIGVPDEENQSLGMRTAISLMEELKEKFDLDYELMINSEPHQRMKDSNGVISQGSIGKMNAFVHVKGVLAHGGKALEGLNPNGLMGLIVSKLDLNDEFSDRLTGEVSVPPTWVYLRDYKKQYDISFPTSTYGILNILNFYTEPEIILGKIKRICEESFVEYKKIVNDKRIRFSEETGRHWKEFDWDTKVLTLSEFLSIEGKEMVENYPEDIDKILENSKYSGPIIVLGFLPPYYPGVTNKDQEKLLSQVNEFSKKMWNQDYDNRMYFTGISDLSYSKVDVDPKEMERQMKNMLGWNKIYNIPFEKIAKLSMNSINVGPWGKDFHRPTERVYMEDLINRTPLIIDNLIMNLLGGEKMFKNVIVRRPARALSNGITSNPQFGKPVYENALVQHDSYIEALKKCGVNVHVLESDERYPDSCFVEDVAVCTKNFVMVTSPGAETRKGEEKEIIEALKQYYKDLEYVKAPGTLEGGDVMMVGGQFYIGLSERTNLEGANQLIDALKRHGMEGSVIEMKEMLHLKTGLAYLEDNVLLVAGEFIENEAFKNYKKIVIDENEGYAANCIRVNDYVLVPEGYENTKKKIEDAGLKVITVDTSEYKKVDGGLSCLSLRF